MYIKGQDMFVYNENNGPEYSDIVDWLRRYSKVPEDHKSPIHPKELLLYGDITWNLKCFLYLFLTWQNCQWSVSEMWCFRPCMGDVNWFLCKKKKSKIVRFYICSLFDSVVKVSIDTKSANDVNKRVALSKTKSPRRHKQTNVLLSRRVDKQECDKHQVITSVDKPNVYRQCKMKWPSGLHKMGLDQFLQRFRAFVTWADLNPAPSAIVLSWALIKKVPVDVEQLISSPNTE